MPIVNFERYSEMLDKAHREAFARDLRGGS